MLFKANSKIWARILLWSSLSSLEASLQSLPSRRGSKVEVFVLLSGPPSILDHLQCLKTGIYWQTGIRRNPDMKIAGKPHQQWVNLLGMPQVSDSSTYSWLKSSIQHTTEPTRTFLDNIEHLQILLLFDRFLELWGKSVWVTWDTTVGGAPTLTQRWRKVCWKVVRANVHLLQRLCRSDQRPIQVPWPVCFMAIRGNLSGGFFIQFCDL